MKVRLFWFFDGSSANKLHDDKNHTITINTPILFVWPKHDCFATLL
jgi:hypothetical protein